MHPINIEARRPSQDGYIWPLPRHQMVDPHCIIERMAEDAKSAQREAGEFEPVTTVHLEEAGWPREYVTMFFEPALRLLRKQAHAAAEAASRGSLMAPLRGVGLAFALFVLIAAGIQIAGALSLIERVA
jgi:hypothetical protein